MHERNLGINATMLSGLEAARLLRRDTPKYYKRVGGLYLLSAVGCELGQTARSSYFFLRKIDDILDGDREYEGDKGRYVNQIYQTIFSDFVNPEFEESILFNHAIKNLEKNSRPDDNPRNDFANAVAAIVFDHERSKDRRTLSARELSAYYEKTFSPLINLMLIGAGSRLRAQDLPEFSSTQGALYSVRDFRDDWSKGIINVPREILNSEGLSSFSDFETVAGSSGVRDWQEESIVQAHFELEAVEKKIVDLDEANTRRLCMGLIKPMRGIIRNY